MKRDTSSNQSGGSTSFRPRNLPEILAERTRPELEEMVAFWLHRNDVAGVSDETLRHDLQEGMLHGERIRDRLSALGPRFGPVFHAILAQPEFHITMAGLKALPALAGQQPYELEAAVMMLERQGFVVPGQARGALDRHRRLLVIPGDLATVLVRQLNAVRDGIFGRLTLRGYLERTYAEKKRGPGHLREMYRMYAGEVACVQRIERLPDALRHLVEKVILEFGGILPQPLFAMMESELPEWDGPGWSKVLGESLVGTVCDLDLRPYGVAQHGPTLIVFSEVALAWFRRVAVPGDPDRPYREVAMGVDTLSNLARFLAFVQSNTVRVTLRGELFKSTWKRMEEDCLDEGQTELPREEMVRMLYRFARLENLIDTTAERTLRIASRGRTWGSTALGTKFQKLLEFALAEPLEEGSREHDLPLRSTLTRMLRHLEIGTWYDLMYLPFLARNQHICNLDEWQERPEDEELRDRRPAGDLQRMAWSLVAWVRKRLFPLGILDLGYDDSGRAVAIRLTRLGAQALGLDVEPGPPQSRGSLVVTPDFELVLFPGEDDGALVHELDRFAERVAGGSMKQFRLTEGALQRGLLSGMQLQHMRDLMQNHSRTPIPENVHVALSDWALRAGLFFLGEDLEIRCGNPVHFERFLHDAGVKPYLDSQLEPLRAKMKAGPSAKRLRRVLRDLDYLVEIE
ncbi:MAG: helicase-associated domain-containing protein [Planctomycetota bacterium]